jgi:MFS transporter, SP family, arabinose:H+ symporter
MENVAEQNYRMVLTEREIKAARMRKFVSFAAGMAGLLFGLDIGVISGALPFITTSFALTSQQQEWVVSAMMLGAALGAVATGMLSSRFGRKYSLLTGAGLFILGSLGSALAVSVTMLLVARVILGFAVGVASYTAPLYLSEMADKSVRGKLIAMYQLMVTVGILIAFLSDTALSFSGDWRLMLGIICVPAVALLLAVFGLPDSPRWLASKGRFEDAKRVLTMLSGNDEKAAVQMKDIKESLEVKQEGWGLFKANKNVRRAVFLGMLLQAMQQFTGMNIIMYYAPKIFSLAGFTSTTDQMIATVFDGLMFVLATFIAMDMVDKAGRKPALKIGFSVMAIGTFILGACLYLIDQGNASTWISYLAVAMTIVCIAGYAMSAAPVVWILCSEIQPLKSRDFGTACSTTTNWVSNMIIGATFLTLLNTVGSAMTFWLYTIMNVIFIFLTIYLLPETKNVSLEQIEKNLMAGKKLKDIGC